MLANKYIVVIAATGLLFSCQKETISTNKVQDMPVFVPSNSSGDESTTFRSPNASANNASSSSLRSKIPNVESALFDKKADSDITDPNNDDDRNKKKKN